MINKEAISAPINKKVLLMSSGMDSYIIRELEEPDVLLFIDNKSEYSQIEKEYLLKMNLPNLVILDDFINMSSIELSNYIIPARNLYFLMIATYFGDEIILGATAGDRSTDKDYRFAGMTEKLLQHIYSESHWCKKRKININFKYKEHTKSDLINLYIEKNLTKGISKEESVERLALQSFSCYSPKEGHQCNCCKPDTRKFLSILSTTGIDISKYYKYSPREYFTPQVIDEWIQKESQGGRGKESLEIVDTLLKMRAGEL